MQATFCEASAPASIFSSLQQFFNFCLLPDNVAVFEILENSCKLFKVGGVADQSKGGIGGAVGEVAIQ